MEIKVYKSFTAIQLDENSKEKVEEILNRHGLTFTLWKSNWLVFSPYKLKWKVYTDEEFKRDFRTLEQIQNEN